MNKKVMIIELTGTITAVFVLSPNLLFANAGIPMLAVFWPLSWFAFIPIVGIEAIIAWKTIPILWRKSLKRSLIANAVSNLVGIPITWGLLLAVEMLAMQGVIT